MTTLFVDPGAMRVELALEQCLALDDGMGGFTEEWLEIGLVFARIEPVSDRSFFVADQRQEEMTHRVVTRWRPDLASGMRLRKGARIFGILTVYDPDESGRYLVCRVKEQGR